MLILLNNFESLGKTSEIVTRTMYAEYLTLTKSARAFFFFSFLNTSNQSVVAVPVLT